MLTLQQVIHMECKGHWHELLSLEMELVHAFSGTQLARVYGALSTAKFVTATSADDYETALTYAMKCYQLASPGGVVWLWALQKITSILVVLGRYSEAERFGQAFLRTEGAAQSPYLQFVLRSLSHVAYSKGRFLKAANLRLQALSLLKNQGAPKDEIDRVSLNVAWAFLRAGRISLARKYIPDTVSKRLQPLLSGLWAHIHMAEGRIDLALSEGNKALTGYRELYDCLDGAEVAILLATICRRKQLHRQATAFLEYAAQLVSLQTKKDEVFDNLVNIILKGGERVVEAVPRCDAAGHKHAGLRGCVG